MHVLMFSSRAAKLIMVADYAQGPVEDNAPEVWQGRRHGELTYSKQHTQRRRASQEPRSQRTVAGLDGNLTATFAFCNGRLFPRFGFAFPGRRQGVSVSYTHLTLPTKA